MRIEVDGVVVAGKDFKESVRQFNLSGGQQFQKIMPLRAAEPTWIERGGESYSVSFEVCRLHNSIPEASIFMWEHPHNVVHKGKIKISEEYDGKRMERQGNGVLRQIGGCRQVGLTTYVRYDLEIGQVKTPNARS